MRSVLCILAILAVFTGQGQGYSDIRKCLFDYYYSDYCPDLNGAIRCVKSIRTYGDQTDKKMVVTETLGRLYQEHYDSWCPDLEKQGTCLARKIRECYHNTKIHYLVKERKITSLCKEYQTLQTCLVNLKKDCDNQAINKQIQEVEHQLKSCEWGNLKSYINGETCYCGIDKCTEGFYRVRRKGQYLESCKLIPSIKKCYENLPRECQGQYLQTVNEALSLEKGKCDQGIVPDVDVKKQTYQLSVDACTAEFDILYGKELYTQACSSVISVAKCLEKLRPTAPPDVNFDMVIFDTTSRCPSPYLIGVCNFRAIHDCTVDIPFDMNRSPNGVNNCTMKNLQAAKQCLQNLSPYCTSFRHRQVLREDMTNINQYCQFPRL